MNLYHELKWRYELRNLRRFNRRFGIGVPEDQLPKASGEVRIVEGDWWVRTDA